MCTLEDQSGWTVRIVSIRSPRPNEYDFRAVIDSDHACPMYWSYSGGFIRNGDEVSFDDAAIHFVYTDINNNDQGLVAASEDPIPV
jgi:hypothetical protein